MKAVRNDFAHRVVTLALGVRLVAIMVALLTFVGETMTAPLLLSTVALTASSLLSLTSPVAQDFIVRHPLALVVDMLVTLGVIAALGPESPLVLATFSTALLMGVLFETRTAMVAGVVLVAGYLLAARVIMVPDRGFMVGLGVPALYVFLVAIGATVRAAHEQRIAADREISQVRESVAAADERARLAREMHDSLGKTLHGIALAAQALPTWVERDPQVAIAHAKDLAAGAQQAAQEARDLLVRMRADQPDRPLAQVLADECHRWEREQGIPCRFSTSGAVDLSTGARYEILAIVAEALQNVARHAAASAVEVVLRGTSQGGVEVVVQDDGHGFFPTPDGGSPRGHFGLTGMQERARDAGATVTVDSSPGRGTRVLVEYRAKESHVG